MQRGREQVYVLVLLRQEVVELGVEHADDLAGLVADDLLLLDVVQRGHGEAALVFRVDFEVDVAQVGVGRVDGVGPCVFARQLFIRGGEAPSSWTLGKGGSRWQVGDGETNLSLAYANVRT